MCVALLSLVCLCACMRGLRVIVCAFAFVYCNVAFHFTRVSRLHVYFALVVSGLLGCACMLVSRVVMDAFACVWCLLAFYLVCV